MEQMSIGQFIAIAAGVIAGLVAFIKGIEYLGGKINHCASKWLENGLAPVNQKLDMMDKKLDEVDMNACKNFLVRFLADIEQGNPIDEIEKERFYETYEHYTSPRLHGNSYIKEKVEDLKKQGKL